MNESGIYTTQAEALSEPTSARQYWLDALDSSSKEEEKWREAAEKAVKIYEGEIKTSFNILHSNTETIVPAVYNTIPVPDCRTRFNDQNEVARKGAQLLERALSYEMDEYDSDSELSSGVYDMVIEGRGVVWVNYEPVTQKAMGKDGQPTERVIWQQVKCERVPWDRFRRGPATSWARVPWVARLKFYTKAEVAELADNDIAEAISYAATQNSELDSKADRAKREKTVWQAAAIWEIWDKDTRKVWYISDGYPDGPVAVFDDPLKLVDFFPCPRPMQALSKRNGITPIVPYSVYSAQAHELDVISTRILKLIEIAKFRGIRAAELPELDNIEDLKDGEFTPSQEALVLLQNGGNLDSAIWVMPLDKLIAIIRELVIQRDQIKQTIYELTGISDILRGATDPNETLGAQQIKAKWGSLKIQNLQKEVQRFCRDLFRVKAEIIAEHFSPDVLNMIAGEPVEPQVLAMLKSDVLRSYAIDIETDSTIRADLARNQEQMAGFMQATAQYIQAIAPAVQTQMLPAEAAVSIFAAFARTFKLGKQVEDTLAKLVEAAPQLTQRQEQESQKQKQMGEESAATRLQKDKAELAGQNIENINAAIGRPSGPGIVQ